MKSSCSCFHVLLLLSLAIIPRHTVAWSLDNLKNRAGASNAEALAANSEDLRAYAAKEAAARNDAPEADNNAAPAADHNAPAVDGAGHPEHNGESCPVDCHCPCEPEIPHCPKPKECHCPCEPKLVCCCEPKVKYCCKPHAECPKICLSDIAGLDNCIEESLRDFATMIKHYKRFQTHGARVPRFVLLTAPAGMQLPRLVEAIAGEACIPFYHVPCRAARKGACIKGTIKAAQEAHKPAIVLIEDVDDHDNAIAKDCVIDFEELICHKTPIIIIATAKCIHKVPLSLLLPGRFDIRIEFPLPSEANREEILRALLKGKPRHKALDIAQIAKDTEDYSPVDLWALVNQALLCAAARFSEVLAEGDFECAKAIISVGEQPPCCPRHHPCPEQPGCPHGGSAVTQ